MKKLASWAAASTMITPGIRGRPGMWPRIQNSSFVISLYPKIWFFSLSYQRMPSSCCISYLCGFTLQTASLSNIGLASSSICDKSKNKGGGIIHLKKEHFLRLKCTSRAITLCILFIYTLWRKYNMLKEELSRRFR